MDQWDTSKVFPFTGILAYDTYRHIYTSFYQLFKKRSVKNRLPHFCDSLQILSLFYVRATLLPLRLRFRTFLR